MKILDCRTLPCPQPVIRCRALLEQEAPSQWAVLVDNDAAHINVRRFLEQRGFAVTVTREDTDSWRLEAQRCEEDLCAAEDLCALETEEGCESSSTLVFITTATLGRGDEGLGARLMETFLATLPEMEDQLWRIVLLNGGVKLAAIPGPALEALQKLEHSGIDVLVCGTCLAHFGLAEARAVGETSNMLDIVTSLALASKVIRP